MKAELFERDNAAKPDVGYAVVIQAGLFNYLSEQKIISPVKFHAIERRAIFCWDAQNSVKSLLSEDSIDGFAIRWSELYNALLSCVEAQDMRFSSNVTGIKEGVSSVCLEVDHIKMAGLYDYCIFADGCGSVGRQILLPHVKRKRLPYVIWRGSFDDVGNMDAQFSIKHSVEMQVFSGGHFLMYLTPISCAGFRVNWVCYTGTPSFLEQQVCPDDRAYSTNRTSAFFADELCSLIANKVSPDTLVLISQSSCLQVRNIYEFPSFPRSGRRLAFIGDAACLVRPHTVSGVTKAWHDAKTLSEVIKLTYQDGADKQRLLNIWESEQRERGDNLYRLGRDLGQFFITERRDWNKTGASEIKDRTLLHSKEFKWYLSR